MTRSKMQNFTYEECEVDVSPFSALIGEDVISFIFRNAPRKVLTRVVNAMEHYSRSKNLDGIDEEMGALRLIAAEEELVVSIFEWLKLNSDSFPEHKDFVSKFKNHVVKLSFYPILLQFRFVLEDMLRQGFTLDGMEDILRWTAKPIVDGNQIKLALYTEKGDEVIRHYPLSTEISKGDIGGKEAVLLLLGDLKETIEAQHRTTLRDFLSTRADFRNKLLYATDAGSLRMGDSLCDLRKLFEQTFHDLLWALALVVGGQPPSTQWGIVSQFIGAYRLALIDAKILKPDNTVAELQEDLQDS